MFRRSARLGGERVLSRSGRRGPAVPPWRTWARIAPRARTIWPPPGVSTVGIRDLLCRLGGVVKVGHRHARQRPADEALDRFEAGRLVGRNEGERFARHAGAAGPADAVDV